MFFISQCFSFQYGADLMYDLAANQVSTFLCFRRVSWGYLLHGWTWWVWKKWERGERKGRKLRERSGWMRLWFLVLMDLGQMVRIWSSQCRGCAFVCVCELSRRLLVEHMIFCDVISSSAKIWWSLGIIGFCFRYPALSNIYLTQESLLCFTIPSLSDSLAFTRTHTLTHSLTNPFSHC